MTLRTVEDRLREEYFRLLPEVRRVLQQLHTEVAHGLLPISLDLKHHERLQIEARSKECESAISALLRREEARQFDEERPEKYSLLRLPDLAGVRVLVFPRQRLEQVHQVLREKYKEWTSDPITTGTPPTIRAWKYFGHCPAGSNVLAELQIVPMLTGLFWEVEHDAFYKPLDPILRGAVSKPAVREQAERIYASFEALEELLERELRKISKSAG